MRIMVAIICQLFAVVTLTLAIFPENADANGLPRSKPTVASPDSNTTSRSTRTDASKSACAPDRVRTDASSFYSSISDAYSHAAAGDSILVQTGVFAENLKFGSSLTILLQGGYDCNFYSDTGYSTINGTLTISDGSVTVDRIMLASSGGYTGRVLYTTDSEQSPITDDISANLRGIVSKGSGTPGVFMKIGDSITASSNFLGCLEGYIDGDGYPWLINIIWDDYANLKPTAQYFRELAVGPNQICNAHSQTTAQTSFCRTSLAAQVGMSSHWAEEGNPTPIVQEIMDLSAVNFRSPQIAIVMYGSNDINFGGGPDIPLMDKLESYDSGMRAIVDDLIARGILPIISSMPPQASNPVYLNITPAFTATARAIAQARQIPFIDLFRAMMPLPGHGLGEDGVHPTVQDYNTACHFDPNGLSYGYNMRNLLTLQALERVKSILADGSPAPDSAAARLEGNGSPANPFIADHLPFTDMRDMGKSPNSLIVNYSCADAPAQPGSEYYYDLVLNSNKDMRILVMDNNANAVRVNLLDSSGTTCLASAPRMIEQSMDAGRYRIVVDSTRTGAVEYSLIVMAKEVSLTVDPTVILLQSGTTYQFNAVVAGSSNTSVSWSSTCGTITDGGFYTAPTVAPDSVCLVTAVSSADASKSATARVSISQ